MVLSNTHLEPKVTSFRIRLETLLGITLKVCHIQTVGRQAVHLSEELPSHLDSFLLEVVTERPVTQHLEESVVVRVLSDIVKIVVLASCTNTLLRVDSALHGTKRRVGVGDTQEDGLVLVHTSVGEKQSGVIVRNGRGGGHKGVLALLEVAGEGVADLSGRPIAKARGGGRRVASILLSSGHDG